jgi:hypothetical protein
MRKRHWKWFKVFTKIYLRINIISFIWYSIYCKLLPEELEPFLKSWLNHKPQKSLLLVVVNYDTNSLNTYHENIEIIDKYIKLGVIKKFKVTDFSDEEFNVSPCWF